VRERLCVGESVVWENVACESESLCEFECVRKGVCERVCLREFVRQSVV